MPVDFDKLLPEMYVLDETPSRFVWTIVLFAIVLVGIFAVLLLWPKGEQTQTLCFWVPVRSGAAPTHYARAAAGYTGVDHGAAYTELPQQKFALWQS
ncbi:hypothetical protein [Paraburkholderia phenoliruptrix]|uniref:hypothetical protein n=1 Tax=Paraburkholderia phenoliruptrix TaxID=252970 RepID=UPI000424DD2F|nr:hypothetical protein [Paraburkholderia phenoliruptrix]